MLKGVFPPDWCGAIKLSIMFMGGQSVLFGENHAMPQVILLSNLIIYERRLTCKLQW
jgi:hypothetical protein